MNAASQFASTMSTMLTAGLPITKALEVTANVADNYMFAVSIRKVRQGVEQGRSLVDCMNEIPYFPKLLTEMVGVGERSGNMEETLTVIGDYFDNEVSVFTQRLLSMLEPAITIVLAVVTVILLLAVYLPMFTMYGSIV
ncbi:MAG: type II secretion system F family protein [Clostridia bacterium]